MTKTMNADEARRLARAAAETAHEAEFHSRRGVYGLSGHPQYCVLNNNNPYEVDTDLRHEELAEFREWLGQNGMMEAAFATYPARGETAGYTFAMVIDIGDGRDPEEARTAIVGEVARIVEASMLYLGGLHPEKGKASCSALDRIRPARGVHRVPGQD